MLTTNSAGFIGDIVKLSAGTHNVEVLSNSHIYKDDLWRPHMRLFFKPELEYMLQDCGFGITSSMYFDNPGLRKGLLGKLHVLSRRCLGKIKSSLNSHVLICGVKKADPSERAIGAVKQSFSVFGISFPDD